jgi:L-seryl-tRNA(Ser) seleniumtransferase
MFYTFLSFYMNEMNIYKRLGVRRVINCFDTYTMIGGHVLSEEVRSAMEEADRNFAWLWELEEMAGRRIAELTGAEAAFVTPGAFAALAMGAAACMTGKDPEKMRRLPDTTGMRNEFLLQRCLRDFKYDRSMTIAGGRIVEAGDERSGCTPEQIEAALGKRTAAIHHMAHGPTAFTQEGCRFVPLERVVEIGHERGVPIIVDAAYQCYPTEGFRRFVGMGADLAAYSCKYFGGPNTAGLLLGRRDLVEAVALHSFVGQEGRPEDKSYLGVKDGRYHGSVFRGYKLDRSTIASAVASLEGYLKTDHEKTLRKAREKLDRIMDTLEEVPGIEMMVLDARTKGVDPLRIALKVTLKGKTAAEVSGVADALLKGEPSIWLEAEGNGLIVGITSFRGMILFDDEDEKILLQKLKKTISKG